MFPGGLLDFVPAPIPIRLQRGNRSWGCEHIAAKHAPWLSLHKVDAPAMVFKKLQGTGRIYTSEEDDKLKIALRIAPSAVVILRFIKSEAAYFRVVTCYALQRIVDGTEVGRYQGIANLKGGPVPAFTIEDPPPATIVTVRHARRRQLRVE